MSYNRILEETMTESQETDILAFLAEFKRLVSGGRFSIVNRRKNREALLALGITENQRKECLLNLRKSDYSEGPLKDKKLGGEVWIFGRELNGAEVYIKIAVNEYNGKHAVCISFHIAERPLACPFR